jgi:hypothetical protein
MAHVENEKCMLLMVLIERELILPSIRVSHAGSWFHVHAILTVQFSAACA